MEFFPLNVHLAGKGVVKASPIKVLCNNKPSCLTQPCSRRTHNFLVAAAHCTPPPLQRIMTAPSSSFPLLVPQPPRPANRFRRRASHICQARGSCSLLTASGFAHLFTSTVHRYPLKAQYVGVSFIRVPPCRITYAAELPCATKPTRHLPHPTDADHNPARQKKSIKESIGIRRCSRFSSLLRHHRSDLSSFPHLSWRSSPSSHGRSRRSSDPDFRNGGGWCAEEVGKS